jgi:hypothetical protein
MTTAMTMAMATAAAARCGGCRHFSGGAAQLETRLPGLASLGSAYGSVRAHDGICERRGRYLAASSVCDLFEAAAAAGAAAAAITPAITPAIITDGEAS